MSFLKYLLNGQTERDTVRTPDGFPIRGNRVPFLKQEELDQVELGLDANVRVFETDNPEHMQAYQVVLDKIANGLYVRLSPDKEEFIPDRKCWLILVRWAEIKGEFAPALLDAIGGYVK